MVEKLTEEEKLERIRMWDSSGLSSWKLNEETGLHEPPVMHPHEALEAEVGDKVDLEDNGPSYIWDEETTSWIEVSDG